MAEEVICPWCGARMREGRQKCLRCGERLPAAGEVQAAGPARRRLFPGPGRRALVAGGVVLALGVFLAAPWATPPGRDVTPAAPDPGGPLSRAVVSGSAPAPVSPGEAARAILRVDPAVAGVAAYRQGNFAVALEEFEQAVRANPRDAESLANHGQLLVRLGRSREAIPRFEEAIKLNPGRWAYHFDLGRAYEQLGEWDSAIAGYRRAAEVFPGDYVTEYNLAMTLHRKGDDREAIEHFRRAVELNPDDPTFSLSLGISCEKAGRPAEAIDAYLRYVELAPQAADADRVRRKVAELRAAAGTAPPGIPAPGPSAGRER